MTDQYSTTNRRRTPREDALIDAIIDRLIDRLTERLTPPPPSRPEPM